MDWKWGEFRMVDPRLIVVDHAYQREEKPYLIAQIANDPDPRAFGVMVVFERDNGVLYCADGQQRRAGVLASSSPPRTVPAIVYPMPGVQDEAQIFWLINVYRKSLTPIEKHKSAVEAKHPADLAIARVVEDLGFTIAKTQSPKSIGAVAALHEIYNLGGEQLVHDTIVLVSHAWPEDRKAFDQNMLRVTAGVVDERQKNGGYERGKMVTAFSRTGPAALFRKAEEIHFNQGTAPRESLRRAIKALCKV